MPILSNHLFVYTSASSNFTDNSLEAPSSPMVTPNKTPADFIVSRLWVTIISWVLPESSFKIAAYLWVLASSNAASVSSKIKNGGGLIVVIAKSKAIEVRALSPPESMASPLILLLGKSTEISSPSSGSSSVPTSSSSSALRGGLINCRLVLPPPKIIRKNLLNSSLILTKPSLKLVFLLIFHCVRQQHLE